MTLSPGDFLTRWFEHVPPRGLGRDDQGTMHLTKRGMIKVRDDP